MKPPETSPLHVKKYSHPPEIEDLLIKHAFRFPPLDEGTELSTLVDYCGSLSEDIITSVWSMDIDDPKLEENVLFLADCIDAHEEGGEEIPIDFPWDPKLVKLLGRELCIEIVAESCLGVFTLKDAYAILNQIAGEEENPKADVNELVYVPIGEYA